MSDTYIIIGASHAAAQLCFSLRQEGFLGRIIVIGDEEYLPYQRPPLSKGYLADNMTIEDLAIRPSALYEKHNIEFLLNTRVVNIDVDNKTISTNNTEHAILHYEKLALCTGANVRKINLPGANLPNMHYLRTLSDIHLIQQSIAAAKKSKPHAVIIGGGYIGLETAAMLRELDIDVTILEGAPRILGRVTAPEVSSFYHSLHESHGVKIQTDCLITGFFETPLTNNTGEKPLTITFKNREELTADFIIIGIGVIPNTELAESAGLEINNGIVTDEFAQTSDTNIVSAGDCTSHPSKHYGMIRLESVPNAMEQAKTAAATLCGKQKPHHGLPWFWSDQYDYKLQIAGLSTGYDKVIVRGENVLKSNELSNFVVYYLKAEKLIAADCINRPKEFMLARQWLQKDYTPDLAKLADDNYELSRSD